MIKIDCELLSQSVINEIEIRTNISILLRFTCFYDVSYFWRMGKRDATKHCCRGKQEITSAVSSSTTSVKGQVLMSLQYWKLSFATLSPEMKTKAAVEPLNPPAADPYAEFLKAQKKREAMWSAERAAKRAKVNSTRVENSREIRSGASQISEGDKVQNSENLHKETTQISESDEVGPLKRDALEKTEAFEIMAKRVENLQESNRLAETRLRNDFCKASFE